MNFTAELEPRRKLAQNNSGEKIAELKLFHSRGLYYYLMNADDEIREK